MRPKVEMNKEETQFDLLKTELELIQKQMDKYDQVSGTIKTWSVTLWIASLGWSFQVNRKEVVLLSIFIVMTFWALDAINKNFREGYKKRRDTVVLLLQDIFRGQGIKPDAISPSIPKHNWKNILRVMLKPHVALLYLVLSIVAGTIFFVP